MIGIMFTDIEGFTKITEKLGEKKAFDIKMEHDEILDKCIKEDIDAKFIKKIGDSFMITFSKPTASVITALNIQRKFYNYNRIENIYGFEIKVRIGIHMGEVTIEDKHGWIYLEVMLILLQGLRAWPRVDKFYLAI